MSCPIGNTLVIKSTNEIFREIASRLIDAETGLTTYEKICQVPEGMDASKVDDWIDREYEDPKGFDGFINEAEGLIDLTTNWRCAQNVIGYLASQYPQAWIEFKYTLYDDEVGVFDCCDIYENGVLIDRKEILDAYEDDDDDDEDEE